MRVVQVLLVATGASGASVVQPSSTTALAAVHISNTTETLFDEDGVVLAGGTGNCKCMKDTESKMVFYNRVPKCGSTTMVTMLNELCKEKGTFNGHKWEGFQFIKSKDFNEAHFSPDKETRKEIVKEMLHRMSNVEKSGKHGGKAAFERHIHFIDFKEFGEKEPVYLNLLRDPASLRASGFYFFRDCVCRQQPAHGDDFADEWCKTDWHLKSKSFCKATINSCYASSAALDECRSSGQSLGGSELTDFMCGASSPDCEDPGASSGGGLLQATASPKWNQRFAAKANRAIDNLKTRYRWVGVLEQLEDSLALAKHMLPQFFGKMDPSYWGNQDIAPDGSSGSADDTEAQPTKATKEKMMEDPYFMMEMKLYRHTRTLLACKLESCGIKAAGLDAARNLEVEADRLINYKQVSNSKQMR